MTGLSKERMTEVVVARIPLSIKLAMEQELERRPGLAFSDLVRDMAARRYGMGHEAGLLPDFPTTTTTTTTDEEAQ